MKPCLSLSQHLVSTRANDWLFRTSIRNEIQCDIKSMSISKQISSSHSETEKYI